MENLELSEEKKLEIARELIAEMTMETLGHGALLKLAKLGIETDAANVTVKPDATFNNQRYSCKMIVTYKKIK